MSFKSIFRAVGRHFASWPMIYRPNMPEAPQPPLQRLTARRDWNWPEAERAGLQAWNAANVAPRPIVTDGEGVDPNRPPPWPAHDDPYTDPGPCVVVTDPALSMIGDYAARTNENTRRLADRGLAGRPFDSVKSVTDLLQLIERQEAAEKELIHRGMEWDPIARRWRDPETE